MFGRPFWQQKKCRDNTIIVRHTTQLTQRTHSEQVQYEDDIFSVERVLPQTGGVDQGIRGDHGHVGPILQQAPLLNAAQNFEGHVQADRLRQTS